MSGDYSDGEGSGGPDADFVDPTADMEMELRLLLEVDMKPDQLREDVPACSGAVDPADLGQDEQRWFDPPNGAKPKWPRHGLLLPIIMELRSPVPGATAQLVGSGAGHHRQGAANPTYPGLADRMPG